VALSQNNLEELFSLLVCIQPGLFKSVSTCAQWFNEPFDSGDSKGSWSSYHCRSIRHMPATRRSTQPVHRTHEPVSLAP
jgi:SNF2 family DNA or RNA helicase